MTNNLTFSQELAFALYGSTEQYPVDFDDAWQWLGYTRKNNAKDSFLDFDFVKNVDFEFCWNGSKTPKGGRPSDSVHLTVECFKMWSMMAGTKQGKQVRLYFLECERIAKDKLVIKTPAELLHEATGRLVEQERRLTSVEKTVGTLVDTVKAHDAELTRSNNTHGRYYSICGYAAVLDIEMPYDRAVKMGKAASALCRELKKPIGKVPDPRFGRVGTYPESVLQQLPW